MIRSKHISTVVVASSIIVAAPATPAFATHIVGHSVAAVQQDVKEANEQAQHQASEARKAAEGAGSHTRQYVQENVRSSTRSASRVASRTVADGKERVERAQQTVSSRTTAARAYTQRRLDDTSEYAQQRSQHLVSAGRTTAGRAQSRAERGVAEAGKALEQLVALAQQRIAQILQRLDRSAQPILSSGSVTVFTSQGEYSFGWTRSGNCWRGRLSTPLVITRQGRGWGRTVEPTRGTRSSVSTSRGDVAASSGC